MKKKGTLVSALLALLLLSQPGEACRGALVRMTPADLWNQADVVLIGVVKNTLYVGYPFGLSRMPDEMKIVSGLALLVSASLMLYR